MCVCSVPLRLEEVCVLCPLRLVWLYFEEVYVVCVCALPPSGLRRCVLYVYVLCPPQAYVTVFWEVGEIRGGGA